MKRRYSLTALALAPGMLLGACAEDSDGPRVGDVERRASAPEVVVVEVPGAPEASMTLRPDGNALRIDLGTPALEGTLRHALLPEGIAGTFKFLGEVAPSGATFSGASGAASGFSGSSGSSGGFQGGTTSSSGFSGTSGASGGFSGSLSAGSLVSPPCSLGGFCSILTAFGAPGSAVNQGRAEIRDVLVPAAYAGLFCAAADLVDCVFRNFRRFETMGPAVCQGQLQALFRAGGGVGFFDAFDDESEDGPHHPGDLE